MRQLLPSLMAKSTTINLYVSLFRELIGTFTQLVLALCGGLFHLFICLFCFILHLTVMKKVYISIFDLNTSQNSWGCKWAYQEPLLH